MTSEQRARAVKIRGFTQRFSKDDVLLFLRDFEVNRHQMIIRQDTLDKSNSEVIVILKTQEERERALKSLSNKVYSDRLIEVTPYLNT